MMELMVMMLDIIFIEVVDENVMYDCSYDT